jgi:hexosaminidase
LENTEKFPLPEDTVVMSWRGQTGGNEAAAMGHKVIMSSQSNGCYLDYRHIDQPEEIGRLGIGTIAQGYNMDPISPEMDEKAASYVMGGQGNLWTENVDKGKLAEYHIFPRICGIGEALWTNKENKNIENYLKRLEIHQCRLDKLGILQYRGPSGI